MLRYLSLGLISSSLFATAACTGAPTPVAPEARWSEAISLRPAAEERRSGADRAAGAVSRILPVEFIRSNECRGEDVEFSGRIHLLFHTQADGSVIGHFNYQQVTGTGLTSGIRYHASTVDHFRLEAPFPSSIHAVRRFRLIGEGSGGNLLVQALFHITLTANGEVAVSIDELTFDCH